MQTCEALLSRPLCRPHIGPDKRVFRHNLHDEPDARFQGPIITGLGATIIAPVCASDAADIFWRKLHRSCGLLCIFHRIHHGDGDALDPDIEQLLDEGGIVRRIRMPIYDVPVPSA